MKTRGEVWDKFSKLAAGRFVLDLQNKEELNFPFLYFSVYVSFYSKFKSQK